MLSLVSYNSVDLIIVERKAILCMIILEYGEISDYPDGLSWRYDTGGTAC